MKLLHFAHRPEAKAFLENSDFTLIKEAKIDLYYSNHLDLALVISGEGHLKALEACLQSILFLEFNWKKPVQEILNLGICGALNQQIQKQDRVVLTKGSKLAIGQVQSCENGIITISYGQNQNTQTIKIKNSNNLLVIGDNTLDCLLEHILSN
jgi:hypothetical protein